MKVLHTPTNVGNQPWVLSRQERELGIQSDLVINYGTWLNYPADKTLGVAGRMSVADIFRRMAFGFSAPFTYDVFHYYFGRSSLYWDDWARWNGFPFLDLRLAKKLGKPVFMTLQGCDARLAKQSNANNAVTMCRKGGCDVFAACLATYDHKRQWLIDHILPLCDKVFYLNPELGHYVPKGNFLPYSNVDINSFEPIYPSVDLSRPPVIVHAPSNGAIKGTPLILDALASLREHFDFELKLVQGVPNDEALALYQSADIAIDQVLAGWYGGVAVEWMAMGKPVLSYLRESDLGFVPEAMRAEIPVRNIRPEHLAEDIAQVLKQRAEWGKWARASRRFVERWHNPQIVARAMVDAYKNPEAPWDLGQYINQF